MTKYAYTDTNGHIAMLSDAPLVASQFTEYQINVTDDDIDKLSQSFQGYIENNLLILRKS